MKAVRIIGLGLFAWSLSASAFATLSWEYFAGGDSGFNLLTSSGALERAVTEARIGNVTTTGTWEQGIWQRGGVGPLVRQGQFQWQSANDVPFTVVYDGASTITFTLGSETLSWDGIAGPFTDIFIRTRAGANSEITLSDLDLVGSGLTIGDLTSLGDGDVDYIRLRNNDLNFGAFTLTGVQRMTWSGTAPTNSALAAQIKFSNIVPEPSSLVLLAAGGLILRSRRRMS